MIAVGSSFRVSMVDLAVTPKPYDISYKSVQLMISEHCCTHQWYVVHAEDNDALVLGRVLRYPTQMSLQYMIPVQEGHLAIWLDPNL